MKHLPVHWRVAAFVKFKPQAGAATAPSDGGAKPSEMFASMGGRLLDE
ncbi:hypothetical protein NQH47_05415 [Burkholderia pseudomallei]|nr:hypothetical protein [Burkholderia pseudomallei]MCQ8220703.1 hypothetical protein [Burkholderia pseudomallei]